MIQGRLSLAVRLSTGLLGLAPLAGIAQTGSRPNVILMVTDDQGYGDMACHGNPWLQTPHLDRLHAESVCLEDYHVDPVCTPTRAALLTGRYSLRTGAWTVTEGRQLLRRNEVTMANLFTDAGYRTAMVGKWHLGDPYPYAPRFRGFQSTVRCRAGGVDEIGNPSGNDFIDDQYDRMGRPERFEGYCSGVWFDETIRFIESSPLDEPDRPFFVYLALNAMHSPFTVPEAYRARYEALGLPSDRSSFYGMIENFDENLGRLLASLAEADRERNTILVFMGDNGSAAGASTPREPGGYNAGMRGWKGSLFEGGHRVACLVRWPEAIAGGRTIPHLTAHIDWLPTLIELCSLAPPKDVPLDGRSLAPLLKGAASGWPERTLFVTRAPGSLGMAKAADRLEALPPHAVLTDRWRMVNGSLYDVRTDPGQRQDLAPRHPDLVRELDTAYRAWFREASRRCGEVAPFLVGAPKENPTLFTVRDWFPTHGSVIWRPSQLAENQLYIQGFWKLAVVRDGRYTVRMSRFPGDAPAPMGADEARLRIGSSTFHQVIEPDAVDALFEVSLQSGRTRLQTWLKDASTQRERGAYHVAFEWHKPADGTSMTAPESTSTSIEETSR